MGGRVLAEATQIINQDEKLTKELVYVFGKNFSIDTVKSWITTLNRYPDFIYYDVKLLALALKIFWENRLNWGNQEPYNFSLTYQQNFDNFTPMIQESLPWLFDDRLDPDEELKNHHNLIGEYESFIIDLERMMNNLVKPIFF